MSDFFNPAAWAGLDLPTALLRITALLLAGACAWAALVALLASWGPTARWARILTPRILRGVVFTAVSGGLAISPAHASDLDGLPLPARGATVQVPTDVATPVAAETPASPSASTPADAHVVVAGESLWTIAAAGLDPAAPTATVAAVANAWYDTNRDQIGDNPDLIHPGQVLEAPQTDADR